MAQSILRRGVYPVLQVRIFVRQLRDGEGRSIYYCIRGINRLYVLVPVCLFPPLIGWLEPVGSQAAQIRSGKSIIVLVTTRFGWTLSRAG